MRSTSPAGGTRPSSRTSAAASPPRASGTPSPGRLRTATTRSSGSGSRCGATVDVGTMGGSYAGSDQSALATLAPSHLRTMVVAVGASNYYHGSMRQNGALEQRFHVYAFRMAMTSKEAMADPGLPGGDHEGLHPGHARHRAAVPAAEGGHGAAQAAVLRAVGHRHPDPRRVRRLLEAAGLCDRRVLRRARRRADSLPRRLVRLLRPQHPHELPQAQRYQAVEAGPAHGPLDPRRLRGDPRRGRRLRDPFTDQPERPAAGLVRPPSQGPEDRVRRLVPGAHLHDGHRQPADARARLRPPPRPRRLLAAASRTGPCPETVDTPWYLRAGGGLSPRGARGGGGPVHRLHLRPPGSRAHHGRRHLGRRHASSGRAPSTSVAGPTSSAASTSCR